MFKLSMAICLSAWAYLLPAQKHDYFWLRGYGGGSQSPANDKFGMATIDFNSLNSPFLKERQDIDLNLHITSASMCDSSGTLLFYSNGENIYGPNHKLLPNGNSIGYNDGYGYRASQGVLALPSPGKKQEYYLFNIEQEQTSFLFAKKLYVNKINMALNEAKGQVTDKKVLLMEDTMAWGRISAIKHANGRDWWVMIPRKKGDVHFRWLLTPNGLSKADTIMHGMDVKDGLGQTVVTPDGKKYIRLDDVNLTLPADLNIYDFDRCSGTLSNQRTKLIDHDGFGAGVAVSPDSRYLYVMRTEIVYQYDLWAADIFATESVVAEYDGFKSHGSATIFYLGQLAPDGRIYVAGLNATFHMHYINFPNRKGTDCEFVQHGLELPILTIADIPNNPNYRLGPLDGSPCDTLSLDNHPLCNFRWEQEDSTLSPLRITFTDLSSYEPTTWHWDFGDGTSSQDTSPVHEYAKKGVYEVCLVVSNQYSADTFCQVLYLGMSSGVGDVAEESGLPFMVMPNPASESLILVTDRNVAQEIQFELFDLSGKLVLNIAIPSGQATATIDINGFLAGLYFYKASGQASTKSGKVAVVR